VTGHILDRDRICLIGKNGCGKSTLLKMMIGLMEPDKGDIFRHPQSIITFLDQKNDNLPGDRTIISLFDHVGICRPLNGLKNGLIITMVPL